MIPPDQTGRKYGINLVRSRLRCGRKPSLKLYRNFELERGIVGIAQLCRKEQQTVLKDTRKESGEARQPASSTSL
jgi:hypothetical protein